MARITTLFCDRCEDKIPYPGAVLGASGDALKWADRQEVILCGDCARGLDKWLTDGKRAAKGNPKPAA